jgi:hypothetical protein
LREFGAKPRSRFEGGCQYLSKVSRCQTWSAWLSSQQLTPAQLETLTRIQRFQKIQKDWFQYLVQPKFKADPNFIKQTLKAALTA